MAVLVSEWTKLRSLRSTYWVIALLVISTVGLGLALSPTLKSSYDITGFVDNTTFETVLAGMCYLGQILTVVLGATFITTEYGSGAIRMTLSAVSNRVALALGKAGVVMATVFSVACPVGLVTARLGMAIAGPGATAGISNTTMIRAAIFGALYVTLVAAMALGLGLLLRNTAATIACSLGAIFLVPLIAAFAGHAGITAAKYAPLLLMEQLLQLRPGVDSLLDLAPVPALLTMLLWAALPLTCGTLTLTTRDA